jgi:predicted transcriptional regulator
MHELGERELDLLQALWRLGRPATVNEVHGELLSAGHEVAYTTVQTMLNRLVDKGRLTRDTSGRAHRYAPLLAREEAAGAAVARVLARFFGGSAEALASHLVESRLGREEAERIRRLLEAHRGEEPP